MDAGDLPDRAGLDDLDHPPVILARVDLRAHLGRQLVVGRRLAHEPDLAHVVGQRLFAVQVLAQPHRAEARRGVDVVRRADDDGVDVIAHRVEHLAEVLELFRGLDRLLLCGDGEVAGVDVADGDDVLAGYAVHVLAATAGDADAGDVEPLVRPQHPPGQGEHERQRRRGGGGLDETAAGDSRGGGPGTRHGISSGL